jgi:peptidoglycan/LPS O-acetylase OafA/YrhL
MGLIGIRKHNPSLDGLRGLAFLLVFVLHTATLPIEIFHNWNKFMSIGEVGVDLFFCLSGFLITRILLSAKEQSHYFRNFYARRALRIFPLYYLFLTLYFLLVVHWHVINFGAAKAAQAGQDLHWLWFYGTNVRIAETGNFITASINHFWTLAVEEHFYLVWPILVYILSPRGLLRAVVIICASAFALRLCLQLVGVSDHIIVSLTPCRVDSFAIAGAVALAQTVPRWREWLERIASTAVLPILVAGVGLFWLGGGWEDTLGYTVIAVAFSLLIVCLGAPGRLQDLFSKRPLTIVGKYSYALYVFHWPIQIGVGRKLPITALAAHMHSYVVAVILNMLLVGVLASAAAFLTWNLVEKHFLKLKRFFPEPEGAIVPQQGVALPIA